MKIGQITIQRIAIGSIAILLLIALIAYVWAGTVTAATGGTAISADTAANGGTGAWTALSGPGYSETINGDLNNGTVILTVPTGFEFNTASPVTVVLTAGDSAAAKNMNNVAVGANVAGVAGADFSQTSTIISFTVFSKSQGNVRNAIQWQGIQVRPLKGTPLASGNIIPSGSSVPLAVVGTNFGTLTEVPGAMTKLSTVLPGQIFTAGTGITGTPSSQTVGTAFNLTQLVATDTFNNPVSTYSGTKTISYTGPSGTATYTTSVNFTGGLSTTTLATTISPAQTTTISASDGTVSGPASSPFTVTSTVNGFNAFESGTATGSTSGIIKTKVSGTPFALDIVALTSVPAVSTGFTGTVKLELVDSSSGSTCSTWPTIQTLANQTFSSSDQGRHNIPSITESNAWKNVRVRISSVASPAIVSCSSDNFSIRPSNLAVAVTDQDSQTAGTTRTINNTALPGGMTHKAGQPFTIKATGQSSTGATTSNYSGSPVAILSQCSSGTAVCPPVASLGALGLGAWSSSTGVITTSTASYSDVGAFSVVFQDQHFADVDAADSTTAERYITSGSVDVGRFIPDHFAVTPVSVTPRTDLAGCVSTFSYMDEPFGITFQLTAQNAANGTTTNYAVILDSTNPSHLDLYFGAVDTALPTALVSRISVSSSSGAWAAGTATVNSTIMLKRNTLPDGPDGPYNSVQIGVAPQDADGVTALTSPSTFNLDADTNGTPERINVGSTQLWFGRLAFKNAYGSELLNLPIPMQTQYWTGTYFQANALDNCTSISSASIVFNNLQGGINAGNMISPGNVTLGGAFAAGIGKLTLTKPMPQPTAKGSVDVSLNLGLENKTYLQGKWSGTVYNQNPVARATFGIYKGGPIIYSREIY